ncbi:hypothetical protein MKW98_003529 [Papaver atlanticum]|uniref:Uncharacterized protein n=1 Tax=Papaver atlanticum TaxID=357466 RepID=A0AAD4TC31_9MAGN|nr:hypothetical protein MKW98_003529 [Papaver atlanticum]
MYVKFKQRASSTVVKPNRLVPSNILYQCFWIFLPKGRYLERSHTLISYPEVRHITLRGILKFNTTMEKPRFRLA